MPRHGPLSPVAHRLVESGLLGQKTGGGVYRYDRGNHVPYESPRTAEILAEVRNERGRPPRPFGPEEIAERLVMRMVNEAFYTIEEGIVQCPEDIDVATVLGIGFPDFRGGLMRFAHDLHRDQVLARLDRLAAEYGERFVPCQMLRGESTPPHIA
jgi:3-hydroxyacyl-CoA dehydrogenase